MGGDRGGRGLSRAAGRGRGTVKSVVKGDCVAAPHKRHGRRGVESGLLGSFHSKQICGAWDCAVRRPGDHNSGRCPWHLPLGMLASSGGQGKRL